MARKAVTSAQAQAIGPYSHGVVGRSDLLFLSGQTPIDPATGRLIDGDAAARPRSAWPIWAMCWKRRTWISTRW